MRLMTVSSCGEVIIDGILHHFLSTNMFEGGGIVSMGDGLRRSRLDLLVCGTTLTHGGALDLSFERVGAPVGTCLVGDNAV